MTRYRIRVMVVLSALFAAACGLAASSLTRSGGVAALLSEGTAIPSSLLPLDLALTPKLGYELVRSHARTYVAITKDHGATWSVAGPPLSTARNTRQPIVPKFLTPVPEVPAIGVSGRGVVFVYGVSRSVIEVSVDRGRSWEIHDFAAGSVVGVTSASGDLFALVDGPQTVPAHIRPAPPPSAWLYRSSDDGRSWQELSALPGVIGPFVELVQPTPTVLFALAPGENNTNDARYGGLVQTTDAGGSWKKVTQPCDIDAAPRFGNDAEFGATSTSALWMVCSQGSYLDRLGTTKLYTRVSIERLRAVHQATHPAGR